MEDKKIDNEIITLKKELEKIDDKINIEKSRINDLNDLHESIVSISTNFNKTIELLSKSISGPTVNNKFKDMYDKNRALYVNITSTLDDEIDNIKSNINRLNEEKDNIIKENKNKKE